MKNLNTNNYSFYIFLLFVLIFFLSDFFLGKFLGLGLDKYYGLENKSEFALVGHSQIMLGMDKKLIEDSLKISVSKYTREGVSVVERKIILNHLISKSENIKTVVYAVDPFLFNSDKISLNSYSMFYPYLENKIIYDFLKTNVSNIDLFAKKFIRTSRYNDILLASSIRGHLGLWDNLKFQTLDTTRLKIQIQNNNYKKIELNNNSLKNFYESIDFLNDKNIKVILLSVPNVHLINEKQTQKYEEVLTVFQNLDNENKNIYYFNFDEKFESKYNLFFDPIHLNRVGQKLFTQLFLNELKNLNFEL